MSSQPSWRYSVERDSTRPGFTDVALVRRAAHQGVLGRLRPRKRGDAAPFFHRTFRPLLQWAALETYAAELGRVAEHANNGTLGCFIETNQAHENVVITLYERWFDGNHLRCDELARRTFDPGDETTLVASAEFLAELEAWAERRNEEREALYLEASVDDAARIQSTLERQSAAKELAQILASEHTGA